MIDAISMRHSLSSRILAQISSRAGTVATLFLREFALDFEGCTLRFVLWKFWARSRPSWMGGLPHVA